MEVGIFFIDALFIDSYRPLHMNLSKKKPIAK